jgi:glycosyltransferase involved in cell wall biosynthesis
MAARNFHELCDKSDPRDTAPADGVTSRVLFVTDHIHFPQGGGGGERNTHELCLALRDRNVAPAVLCSLSADHSWLSWSNRIRRVLPPRQAFPCDTGCGYPVFRGWRWEHAEEVINSYRPDVVVVQSTHPDPLLRALATAKVPVSVYFHEVEEIDHLRSLADTGIPVLANSSFTAQRLMERCGLRCEVVLPLIDPRHYVTKTQPERLLFINTVPRKGLEIAFGLAERRPDIPCDFVLSWILPPERIREIEARARAAGNITLHPPAKDMRVLYATARVLLAPSQWEETWGRVASEAHINGIPVLGSDRGGLPQAIGPGGLVVPAEAPIEVWAEALARLWDDGKTHDAFARAAREYSGRAEIQPATIVRRLKAILETVVNNGHGVYAGETLSG